MKHERIVEQQSGWDERLRTFISILVLIDGIALALWIGIHAMIALEVFEGVTLGLATIIGVWLYFLAHASHHKKEMQKLERREFEATIRHRETITRLLDDTHQMRHNYKTSMEGNLEVIHQLPPPSVKVTEVKEDVKELPPPTLPGPCDFADILETWRPSPQQILLALAPGGQPVMVPLKALCHVALAGATGGGKSVLMRLLLSQLIYVDARVILADPHFAPVDPESGEDWRPIANRLVMEPAIAYPAIKDTLRWLASDELPKRLERRRLGEQIGTPYFLAMDELPAIVKNVPEAPEYMGDLLREGRKVGLYLVSAAQDWLVKTVGGSGAVRDCFRTAFYVGGDTTSARVLLDVKGRVDDGGLGRGIVMMRSYATPMAALSRIPYASNEALYELLTTAGATAGATANRYTSPLQNTTAIVDTEPEIVIESKLDARALRIREMVKDKIKPSKIIEEVWGISAKQGGDAYRKASDELAEIMATLV